MEQTCEGCLANVLICLQHEPTTISLVPISQAPYSRKETYYNATAKQTKPIMGLEMINGLFRHPFKVPYAVT